MVLVLQLSQIEQGSLRLQFAISNKVILFLRLREVEALSECIHPHRNCSSRIFQKEERCRKMLKDGWLFSPTSPSLRLSIPLNQIKRWIGFKAMQNRARHWEIIKSQLFSSHGVKMLHKVPYQSDTDCNYPARMFLSIHNCLRTRHAKWCFKVTSWRKIDSSCHGLKKKKKKSPTCVGSTLRTINDYVWNRRTPNTLKKDYEHSASYDPWNKI